QPALAQICSLPSPFEQDLADYSAGACRTIEVWLTKLETYLETHSIDDVRALCKDLNVTLPVAAIQGGVLLRQGHRRREAWTTFERRIQLCKELSIGTIIVSGDIIGPLEQTDLDRVQMSLQQAAQLAGQAGVRVALEFQGRAAFCNNLQTAAAL